MRWWWTAPLLAVAALVALAACNSIFSSSDPLVVDDAGEPRTDAGTGADGQSLMIDPSGTTDGGATLADAGANGTDAAADAGPTSCATLRTMTGAMTDGKYTIDVDGPGPIAAFQVYCLNMTDPTKTPSEYLSVTTNNGGNTSRFAVGGYCTGCAGDFVRQFSRVRLRVPDLTVLTSDLQFATPLSACGTSFCQGTGLEWGMAGSCVTNNDASGSANIDLTGTPFHVATAVTFVQEGAMPAGTASISGDRKTVTLTGGGACGWTQAAPAYGSTLKLEHD